MPRSVQGGMRPPLLVALALATLILPSVVIFVPAEADSTTTMTAQLPSPRTYTSAVWTGQKAYVFGGGAGNGLREIVEYDPATDTVQVKAAQLPHGRYAMSAIYDGTHAYLFGGVNQTTAFINILRYTPATDTLVSKSTLMPRAGGWASAVWTGTYAYILGGRGGCPFSACAMETIVRYDPATDQIATMPQKLLKGTEAATAAWTGQYAFLFGGWNWTTSDVLDIQRYDPAAGTVTMMNAKVPTGTRFTSSVWDGTHIYIFGGFLHPVYRYDPAADVLVAMTAPAGNVGVSAIWTGNAAYLFGGHVGAPTRTIARFTREPDAPTGASATPDAQQGAIRVEWQAPPANSYSSPLTKYGVSRSSTLGGPYSLLAEVPEAQTAYHDYTCFANQECYYRVRATNAHGTSPMSNEAAARGLGNAYFRDDFNAGSTQNFTRTGLWRVTSCQFFPTSGFSLGYVVPDPGCHYSTGSPTSGTATAASDIVLPIGTSAPHLVWKSRHHTRAGPDDLKRVSISTTAGLSWTTVWTEDGLPAFWNVRAVDLTPYDVVGKPLRFRFEFTSGTTAPVGFQGWHVDDVFVTGTPPVGP